MLAVITVLLLVCGVLLGLGLARLTGLIPKSPYLNTSTVIRQVQSGYIYHYAFAMIIGILLLMSVWFAWLLVSGVSL